MKKLLFVLLLSPFAAQAGLGDAIGNVIGNTLDTGANVADAAVEGTVRTVDQAAYDVTNYPDGYYYRDGYYYDRDGNRVYNQPRTVKTVREYPEYRTYRSYPSYGYGRYGRGYGRGYGYNRGYRRSWW